MKNKKYYSSFCNYIINAQNEAEAFQKARKLKIDKDGIMTNLEPWNDADTIEEIKKYEKNRE